MAQNHLKIDLNLIRNYKTTKENLNMMLHLLFQDSVRSIGHRSNMLTTHISFNHSFIIQF